MPVPASMLFNIPDTQLQPPYGADGDPATRYSTGAAGVGTEWFQLDLCRSVLLSGVHLLTAPDNADVPGAYNVKVSLDGTTWTQVAASTTSPPADAMIAFTTPTVARYVRINQTGMVGQTTADGGFKTQWWSIHEFGVTCPTGGGDGGAPVDSGSTGDAARADATVTDSGITVPLDASVADVISTDVLSTLTQ